MNMIRKTCLAGLFALLATPAFAGGIEVHDARATLPLAKGRPAAGYVEILNGTGADDVLLAISIPGVARVEMHEMTMDGGVMRMREMKDLPLKAGETVTFEPGDMHLMLFGVDPKPKPGTATQVTLTFRKAGKVSAPMVWGAK